MNASHYRSLRNGLKGRKSDTFFYAILLQSYLRVQISRHKPAIKSKWCQIRWFVSLLVHCHQ
jgi:hypothetical protein